MTSLPEFMEMVDPKVIAARREVELAQHRAKAKATYDPADHVRYLVILEAVRRYLAMLRVDQGRDWNEDRFGAKTSVGHLKWMLEEIESNLEQSITKKHRWLGFIQGLLIAYGFSTVDREREMTRDLFRGA